MRAALTVLAVVALFGIVGAILALGLMLRGVDGEMNDYAWLDVGIMAGGCIALVIVLALVETASQALKRRRHAREARHVCGVCHTTHSS